MPDIFDLVDFDLSDPLDLSGLLDLRFGGGEIDLEIPDINLPPGFELPPVLPVPVPPVQVPVILPGVLPSDPLAPVRPVLGGLHRVIGSLGGPRLDSGAGIAARPAGRETAGQKVAREAKTSRTASVRAEVDPPPHRRRRPSKATTLNPDVVSRSRRLASELTRAARRRVAEWERSSGDGGGEPAGSCSTTSERRLLSDRALDALAESRSEDSGALRDRGADGLAGGDRETTGCSRLPGDGQDDRSDQLDQLDGDDQPDYGDDHQRDDDDLGLEEEDRGREEDDGGLKEDDAPTDIDGG